MSKSLSTYSLIIICFNNGTPYNHNFPCGINGKVMVLGVPILKHFRVLADSSEYDWTYSHSYDLILYFHDMVNSKAEIRFLDS